MRPILLALLLSLFIPVGFCGEAAREDGKLDLAECLGMAEARSEPLGQALAEIEAAKARGDLARSATLPEIALNFSHTGQEEAVGGGQTFNLSPRERTEDWISVRQPIFSGFRDLHTRRQMRSLQSAADLDREQILLELRLATAEAYARVLSAEEQHRAVESSLGLARSHVEELRARRESGLARQTELLLAEARQARSEADQARAQGARSSARAVLAFLIGEPADRPLEPIPSFPLPCDEPGELTTQAAARRKDLAGLALQMQAARDAIRAEQGGWWPRIDANGNWYEKREGPSEVVEWEAGISATWPIFEGGRTGARVREARSRQQQAQLEMQRRRRELSRETEAALAAHRASAAAVAGLQREVRAAQETSELLSEEFRQGIATQLELLTAQNTLLAARVELARQALDERLAVLSLWRIFGEFPPMHPTNHHQEEK
jgi:outer membrane protein